MEMGYKRALMLRDPIQKKRYTVKLCGPCTISYCRASQVSQFSKNVFIIRYVPGLRNYWSLPSQSLQSSRRNSHIKPNYKAW